MHLSKRISSVFVRLGVFDLRGGWILWWRIRGWVVVREVA
jgi:hypothetical protein